MINNKKNVRYKKVNRLYILLFVALCLVFGRTIVYQVIERQRLNEKIQTLEEKKDKLNQEIDIAKKDIQNVDDKDFIVKVARQKLKMVDKNEVIVKYKDQD
ncbi:MAG: septum formation initiator family protein [Peptoniphilaceae bacterium]|uniref:FtsB family cell division protein n=1 Tax=Parvimonas sp. TaxID=1944660 RepID=UPI0025E7AF15|nr:septum formation initiator family protein [Parvimonas sp.]MCI5997713.1 septum formation initiator family protein [Parvimonas sp.]MDD7765568.1 septum formation initiator family protein [Peptoniphilaceae bacterium]MDY3051109.1 septum formation initiator family protein [Parvimonas sp.]